MPKSEILIADNEPLVGEAQRVHDIVPRHCRFAQSYYVQNGKPTGEQITVRCAIFKADRSHPKSQRADAHRQHQSPNHESQAL
jgi:hypothetical protein